MNSLRQVYSVTAMSLLSLPQRLGTSLVVVFGIAGVVGVLISVLAMAVGFTQTAAKSGRADRAIVLSVGAVSELQSSLAPEASLTIMNAPGVQKTPEGRPIASVESLAAVRMTSKATGRDMFGMLRGVGPEAFLLRPEITLVEGRFFQPGLREVIVGRAAQSRLAGTGVGDTMKIFDDEWTIAGVFESNSDSHESEMLTDEATMRSAFQSQRVATVTVQLENADAFDTFKDALTTDPTLSVDVKREMQYFADSSQFIGQLLNVIAYGIGGIMALGAIFGALNTMYSTISKRSMEIATLRAIGFGATPVVVSVFIEALLLALVGAALGAFIAWFFFNGNPVSTVTGTSPSQVTYSLAVTPSLISLGIAVACCVGIIGGIFPALRAARMPVATAMRAA